MLPPLPLPDEERRLEALRRYNVLDTPPEAVLDDLTTLAAHLCETPISLISLVDKDRQWFKSRVGMAAPELPRNISFCGHNILQRDIFLVEDATQDARFSENPLVTGDLHVRFYAGVPLLTPDGRAIGTFCVIDREARSLTGLQLESLRVLGRQVMAQLELRRQMRAARESDEHSRMIVESALDAIVTIDEQNCITEFNPAAEKIFGRRRADVLGQDLGETIIPERFRQGHRQGLARYLATGHAAVLNRHVELTAVRPDGTEFPIELTATRVGSARPARFTAFIRDITVRKQTEQALREKSTQLQAALSVAEMGVWRMDFCSDQITTLQGSGPVSGLSKEIGPTTGRAFLELLHPDDRPYVGEQIANARAGGDYAVEFRIVLPDGGIRWVAAHGRILRDASGEAVTLTGVDLDITDRKIAEEALRASEARYRTLFEHAPDGIVIADSKSYYLDGNASLLRMLGYTREEFIGMHGRDLVAQAEIDQIAPALAQIKSSSSYHREWQLRRKDGTIFSAEVIATSMPDGNIMAMIRDVSERKRSQARFRRLVDSNAQGVIFWDRAGQITGANDAFLHIVGFTRADLEEGRVRWDAMTPPEYADLDRRALEEIAVRGACAPFEKEYFRKDGTRVPIMLGAANFEDAPDEGVCFVLDLTERKKLEQQFLRVQRLESIGTLAGGIAHDLNNVLAPIIMSLDLLQMRFPDAASQELLSIVSSSAQRGADMVRQVLSFARGVEGQRIQVQIRHLIGDIRKIANETFLKHIQIRTNIPHDLWTVAGDATQLRQVLLNLCVNARDAMPNGGTLTISAENQIIDAQYAAMNLEATLGPHVILRIEDSGSGIPPAIINKIFDPFFTTKEVGKGTGLGLSTSLAIIKSHGGFFRVHSHLGKGATFEVYLPAQTEGAADLAPEVLPVIARGNGELVMVVDDEPSVRLITQQTLEAFGYRVVLASDGTEAVSIFARQSGEIAVVLTDMMMPVMDGPATIHVLRKIKPDVRIIAASGLSTGPQVSQAGRMGVKHFLAKPYTAETLLRLLKRVLSEDRAG